MGARDRDFSPPVSADACPAPPHRLVPFTYVADVESSLAFYALLGFEHQSIMRDPDGRANWAWTQTRESPSGCASLMLSRTWRPIVPGNQDIFFYMHTRDLKRLRDHLLAHGVRDGGARENWEPAPGRPRSARTLFAIHHPTYMPGGEFRVHDPDGYCILVGQHEVTA